eukprot:328836_1
MDTTAPTSTFPGDDDADDELTAIKKSAEESEEIQEIIALIICSLFLIIYIILFSKLFAMSKGKNQRKRTSQWVIALPIIYVTIYTLRYCLELIEKQGNVDNLYLETILDLCFVIGNGVFYLIMITRLKIGFEQTQYKLSQSKLILLIVLLVTLITINILYYLIKSNGVDDPSLVNDRNLQRWNTDDVHTTFFILLVLNNLILATILVYSFVKNIALMIIAQHGNCTPHEVSSGRQRNSLSEHQLNLLSIAVRYALLCSIAIICTNIQFTGWILFSFDVFEGDPLGAIWFSIVNEWLWDVVLITNFLCILLTFYKITKQVYQCACSSCHSCCRNSIEFCIIRYIERKGPDRSNELKQTEITLTIPDGANYKSVPT